MGILLVKIIWWEKTFYVCDTNTKRLGARGLNAEANSVNLSEPGSVNWVICIQFNICGRTRKFKSAN